MNSKKIIKNILLLIIFFTFLFALKTPNNTYSIYKEELNTTISLTINSANGYDIRFDSQGGSFASHGGDSIVTVNKNLNDTLGTLETPTKADNNFDGWYTAPIGGTRINSETEVTGNTTYYAHWVKIVCKKAPAGTLHSETCVSGGCVTPHGGHNANDVLTYGSIPGANSPIVGDAYDCDVNNDGTYDSTTERFYFIRSIDTITETPNLILVHYTSFDDHGQMDSSKDRTASDYDTALTYLPTSTLWTNPDLVTMDGNITRFISREDLTIGCGSANYNGLNNCEFLLENSRFQSLDLGRAGIWLLVEGTHHYRIQTETFNVAGVEASSKNTARPTIQISSKAIEGYVPKELYTVRFDSQGGSSVSKIDVFEGDTYGNLETPTKGTSIFAGWYTDPTGGTQINSSMVVTGNITLYAHWIDNGYLISFNTDGGDPEPSIIIEQGHEVGELPIPTWTNHYFGGWYKNNDWQERVTSSTIPTESTTYYARWYDSAVAQIGDIYYTKLSLAIADVPTNDTEVTIKLIKNTSEGVSIATHKKIKLDLQTYTVSYSSGPVITNNGTLTIISESGSGSISGSSVQAAINNNSNGKLYVKSGNISSSNTTKAQAIYNDGGRVEISGGTLSNVSQAGDSDGRAAVQNTTKGSGKIIITGGTITSENNSAVKNDHTSASSLVIGTKDEEYSTTSPILQGKIYGVRTASNIEIYDGILKGETAAMNDPTMVLSNGIETGSTQMIENVSDYNVLYYYLENPKWNLTFIHNDGTEDTTQVSIDRGDEIGTFPTVTYTNHILDGWFTSPTLGTQVYTTTIPDGNRVYYARWTGNINVATISPSSINLIEGQTQQLTITSQENMESYTLTPENSSIISVTEGGLVTALSEGSTTITITGSRSTETRTINVVVNPIPECCSVTFDNDGVTNIVYVGPNETIGDNMPQDPTKSGNIFVGWFIDGDIDTPFDSNVEINSNLTVVAEFTDDSNVARIGGTYFSTLNSALSAVPTTDAVTEVVILQDITTEHRPTILAHQNVVIDAGNHTLTCGDDKNIVYNNNGIVTIKNGTYTCDRKAAPLENNTSGTMYITGGTITNTLGTSDGRAAVYNGGALYVYDGAQLSSAATDRPVIHNYNAASRLYMSGGHVEHTSENSNRGAIQNEVAGAEIHITGGTVISKSTNASTGGIQNNVNGVVEIGTSGDGHSTSSPIILGKNYGVISTVAYSFYDGKIGGYVGAVNDISLITGKETGYVAINPISQETIDGTTYNILYYVQPEKYRINLNANGGSVTPTYVDVIVGDSINSANDLYVPTWANHTFGGWYTDQSGTTPVNYPITPTGSGETTIYAKWTYVSSTTPVSFNMVNDVMTEYFDSIDTWKNLSVSKFESTMLANFNSNNCSPCNGANNCESPQAGKYCELPKGYDTGIGEDLNVYIYDTANQEKGSLVTYTTSDSGIIYNMIPGNTYYWESVNDSSIYGVVEASGQRRTIYTGIRNVRDLGGLEVDVDQDGIVDGTLKYGKLLRGAHLRTGSDGASDVASLVKLGVTREVDLRAESEGGSQSRMQRYDFGDYTDPNNVQNYQDSVITNYHINPVATQYLTTPHENEYTAFKANMKQIMSYIAYENESIFFHCTIGTDRTGTMAYFLEGLLGVSLEDRLEDYELSYFFGMTNRHRYHDHLDGSNINPRFKSMYQSYDTYQKIYDFYTYGDTAEQKAADDQLLADFRAAMIDSN